MVVQGAPSGAQTARQASLPAVLGEQIPEQQSAAREQGRPSARQAPAMEQWELASQLAALSQQSVGFLHAAPVALQPGTSAQRSTPSGTVRQVPEQQSSFDWQRSFVRKHPPALVQRPSAPQMPEQQSLGAAQRSKMILHPGRALQLAAPLGATWHSPAQQSVALLQVSPATRHPGRSIQPLAPSTTSPHWPPQQSPAAAQVSPATWHPGGGGAHFSAVHCPEQQSLAAAQAAFAWAQMVPPQVPALVQPRSQHAPARPHKSPSLEHPAAEAQTSCPLLSCWQR
jgi:hypothetical protein